MTMHNKLIGTGALLAFLAVALGAFGAHGLKGRIEPELLEVYRTGVLYHLVHALGIVLIGVLGLQRPGDRRVAWSAITMIAGTVIFSGTLYLLAVTGIRWLGAITPIGGVMFLLAWAILAVAMFRPRS